MIFLFEILGFELLEGFVEGIERLLFLVVLFPLLQFLTFGRQERMLVSKFVKLILVRQLVEGVG